MKKAKLLFPYANFIYPKPEFKVPLSQSAAFSECLCLKEVERSMELSSSSFQRQLVAEKKKTLSAQEEIRTLHEELERLTNKLKVHKINVK